VPDGLLGTGVRLAGPAVIGAAIAGGRPLGDGGGSPGLMGLRGGVEGGDIRPGEGGGLGPPMKTGPGERRYLGVL